MRRHPELPPEASVTGRLIVRKLAGARQPWLYLFTMLEVSTPDVLERYGERRKVETDLRSLKQTQFSFARTLTLVQLQMPKLLAAKSYHTCSRIFNLILDDTARYHQLPATRH